MSRITNVPVKEIDEKKIDVLQNTSDDLGAAIVLKGAHSLIGFPGGKVFVNMSGNSGMASAGSGDVLTGSIAAMHGLGLSIDNAVSTGVFIHGFAGDLAAGHKGEDGITAQDLIDYLPHAVKKYREEYDEVIKDCCRSIYTAV
jgi:NAD(P)H-hydrate epimerase